MRYRLFTALAVSGLFLALTAGALPAAERTGDFDKIPAKGMVTMIDLGSKSCIPCKLMSGTLVKLDKLYRGKAAIIFIDVNRHRDQGYRFGIRGIPTQIFFDADAREVYRHEGFMSEEAIVAQLKEMGVDLQKDPRM